MKANNDSEVEDLKKQLDGIKANHEKELEGVKKQLEELKNKEQ